MGIWGVEAHIHSFLNLCIIYKWPDPHSPRKGPHWMRSCVGLRAGLDLLRKRNVSCFYRDVNPASLFHICSMSALPCRWPGRLVNCARWNRLWSEGDRLTACCFVWDLFVCLFAVRVCVVMLLHEPFRIYHFVSYEVSADMALRFVTAVPYPYGTILAGHLTLYSPVVTICTTNFTFNNSTFCPHSVFMCFVWISEQTAIISLYSINWLVFITEI